MRVLLVVAVLLGLVKEARGDDPAPPPTALTCSAPSDCPSGATCWQGECVEAPAAPAAPAPTPAPAPVPAPAPTAPPGPAVTPQADIDAAKVHFLQGVALLNTGNYSAALAELTESYRLRPMAGVHKNIAVAQQGLFRYADAIGSLQRYLDESQSLTEAERAEATQLIGEMRALLAEITIDITPAGAVVLVDRHPVGTAPFASPLSIASGTHAIEVTADGHHPQKRDVMVAAGVAQRLTFELVPIPRSGLVRVTASVPRATVVVDGKPAGIAPLELELGIGGHSLEVTATGYRIHRSEVMVAGGQTREIRVALDRAPAPKRWYQKWQIVTPIAAGVTAVALGLTIGYATKEDPIVGTLQPGVGAIR